MNLRNIAVVAVLVTEFGIAAPPEVPPQSKPAAPGKGILSVDFCYSKGSGVFVQRTGQGRPEQWSTSKSVVYPALSPSGSTLAITLETNSKTNISGSRYLALLENPGAQPKIIFGTPDHHCYRPIWSPDGEKIMFNNHRDRSWGVSVINKDGSGYRDIIYPGKDNDLIGTACWGPDGKSLFAYDFHNLYWVDLNGTLIKKIPFADLALEVSSSGSTFSLSPDGSRMLMAVSVDLPDMDKFEFPVDVIFLLDLQTSKVTRLSPGGALASCPAWMPDGKSFLFHGDGSLKVGVYLMELGSKRPVLLVPGGSNPTVRSR